MLSKRYGSSRSNMQLGVDLSPRQGGSFKPFLLLMTTVSCACSGGARTRITLPLYASEQCGGLG